MVQRASLPGHWQIPLQAAADRGEGSQLQALTTGVVPQGTPAQPPWTSQAD